MSTAAEIQLGVTRQQLAIATEALIHPSCHEKFSTDAGMCVYGCPACKALKWPTLPAKPFLSVAR